MEIFLNFMLFNFLEPTVQLIRKKKLHPKDSLEKLKEFSLTALTIQNPKTPKPREIAKEF